MRLSTGHPWANRSAVKVISPPKVPSSMDADMDLEGKGRGFLSVPDGGGPFPAVIVIHEILGLDDHIRSVARRFSKEGLYGLAPDLYGGRVAKSFEEGRKLRAELEEDRYLSMVRASISVLNKQAGIKRGRIGIVGFCMGGGLSLLAGCSIGYLMACVDFYGKIEHAERVVNMKCPFLGIFGEYDEFITPWAEEELKPELQRYGKRFEWKVYPKAPHAFHNDTKESYRPEAAKDAWQRTVAFFRKHL